MDDENTGESRISVYLTDVTEADVQDVAERICDLLRDMGMGNRDDFRSLVMAEAWEWPASDAEAFVEELRVAGGVLFIPDPGSGA